MNAKPDVLLTRIQFHDQVFARDNNRCVLCGRSGQDAHHIIERRLWSDGGYYVSNGATLCGDCHIKAEQTLVSPEQIREAAGITRVIVPDHMYPNHQYDKWANPVLPDGRRLRGELFSDGSVQKVLREGGVLDLFVPYVKYPRTMHLPWSKGMQSDDKRIASMDAFYGQRVIVTSKMDGEQTTMYSDFIHQRSLDPQRHPSRDWVKNFWATIKHDIPEGYRVCGENLYAKHSIAYDNLPSYFLGFSVWDETNTALDWDETLEYFALLGITPVNVMYDGVYDESVIKALWSDNMAERCEGYVLRLAGRIEYSQFRNKVGKFVRSNHVQTVNHWLFGQRMEVNGLAK